MKRLQEWTKERVGYFIVDQLVHTMITAVILGMFFFGVARVGALNEVLAPTAAETNSGLTTINYQGHLADKAGNPLEGTYGMSFSLHDAMTDGNLIWGPEEYMVVPVSEGLFSVGLGSKTSGGIPVDVWSGDRYLEISIEGETLSPRELIRGGIANVSLLAFTVPDGSIGQTEAPSLLEGPDDDYRVETGSFYLSNGSDGWREQSVEFAESFVSAPKVFITLNGSVGPIEIEQWENAGVHSVDNSGFMVKAFAKSSFYGIRVDWVAIGH